MDVLETSEIQRLTLDTDRGEDCSSPLCCQAPVIGLSVGYLLAIIVSIMSIEFDALAMLIGRLPDREVAEILHLQASVVRELRLRLGIPAYSSPAAERIAQKRLTS